MNTYGTAEFTLNMAMSLGLLSEVIGVARVGVNCGHAQTGGRPAIFWLAETAQGHGRIRRRCIEPPGSGFAVFLPSA